MSLTQSEINEFNENGFLPCENLLNSFEVTALRLRLEDIGNEVMTFPQEYVQIEPQVESGEMRGALSRFESVRKIWNLTIYDALFQAYASHPKILEVVKSLIGPNLKIFADQTLCKPARVGSAKVPHQDSAYWTNIDPPDLVICWMALTDATEENGCMRFLPGSHKQGVIEHSGDLNDFGVSDDTIDYHKELPVALKAGGCSFHHSLVLHRTDANTSPNPRIGLTVAYMSAHSKYVGEGPQPDYELVAGREFEGCV